MIKKYQTGFTLLEIIISIGIITALTVAFNRMIVQGYRSTKFGQEQMKAIKEAQKGIDTMAKELREMGYGEDGSYPLELADNQEIIFYSDIDKDIYTERVRYFLEGTNLKKGVVEPTGNPLTYVTSTETIKLISKYVRNDSHSIFTYYNGDYPYDTTNNPLPAPARLAATKLLHILLEINYDISRAPHNFDLQTDVQLRNLKDNL